MYHAWEDTQFEGGIGHREVLATPLNPLGLVGGYPYLDPTFGARQPGMNDRDTWVEIRKLGPGSAATPVRTRYGSGHGPQRRV